MGAFFRSLDLPYPPETPEALSAGPDDKTLLRVAPSSSPPYTPLEKATRDALDPSDVFLLAAPKVVYVRLGTQASGEEKRSAMLAAQRYIADSGMRPETTIIRVVQGRETEAFWDALDN